MSAFEFSDKLRLIVLAAPSGGGKTTLCTMLLKEFPQIALSISTTTRPMRPNEINGVHYHFVTDEQFKDKIAHGDFAEWAHVHNRLYGTARSTIEEGLKRGKHLLFDIDVQGAKSLKGIYPKQSLNIFIHPPSIEILESRLRLRQGDSEESIQHRLANAKAEIAESHWFDYHLTNTDLQETYEKLREVVKKECHL